MTNRTWLFYREPGGKSIQNVHGSTRTAPFGNDGAQATEKARSGQGCTRRRLFDPGQVWYNLRVCSGATHLPESTGFCVPVLVFSRPCGVLSVGQGNSLEWIAGGRDDKLSIRYRHHGGRHRGPGDGPGRKGYKKTGVRLRDVAGLLTFRGFGLMGTRYWKMGLGEMFRSWNKKAFVKALQVLLPELGPDDVQPGGHRLPGHRRSHCGQGPGDLCPMILPNHQFTNLPVYQLAGSKR